MLTLRTPWQGPDKVPNDLASADLALKRDMNPNDPVVPKCLLQHHNRWGIVKTGSRINRKERDPVLHSVLDFHVSVL